jgi:hypothetical protein
MEDHPSETEIQDDLYDMMTIWIRHIKQKKTTEWSMENK